MSNQINISRDTIPRMVNEIQREEPRNVGVNKEIDLLICMDSNAKHKF